MLMGSFGLFSMEPVWTGVFIASSVLILTVLGIVIGVRRKRRGLSARRTPLPLLTSIEELNETIGFTGFVYDEAEDIFCSLMNPWQREFGYCRFYDEAAAALSLIIDAEPIYFDYGGKHWLVEFWKGQYGMTTGGEVGVYNAEDDNDLIDWNGRIYQSASDDELLDIYHTLYKNGRPLFTRHDMHWWLTGFVLGEFSQPEELSMVIRVIFKNIPMRDAFLKGLREAGYGPHEYRVRRNAVAVYFDKPHTAQPLTRTNITDSMSQSRNRAFCELYQQITGKYTSILDKINALRQENVELYNQAIHIGKQRELFQSLNKLKGEKETASVNKQPT